MLGESFASSCPERPVVGEIALQLRVRVPGRVWVRVTITRIKIINTIDLI